MPNQRKPTAAVGYTNQLLQSGSPDLQKSSSLTNEVSLQYKLKQQIYVTICRQFSLHVWLTSFIGHSVYSARGREEGIKCVDGGYRYFSQLQVLLY